MNRLRKNKKGSLLIEALLSVAILSISLTIIIQSITSSMRAMAYSVDYTIAKILLENKMNELIQKGSIDSGISQTKQFASPYEDFRYVLTTAPFTANGINGQINEVNLEINWARGKKTNRVLAKTYILAPSNE